MADTHKKKWARKLDLCSSHKSDYWCGLTGWMIEVTIMMLMAVPFSSFVANTFLHLGFLSLFSYVSLFILVAAAAAIFLHNLLISNIDGKWFVSYVLHAKKNTKRKSQ